GPRDLDDDLAGGRVRPHFQPQPFLRLQPRLGGDGRRHPLLRPVYPAVPRLAADSDEADVEPTVEAKHRGVRVGVLIDVGELPHLRPRLTPILGRVDHAPPEDGQRPRPTERPEPRCMPSAYTVVGIREWDAFLRQPRLPAVIAVPHAGVG